MNATDADEQTAAAAEQVGAALLRRAATVSVAESLTGGLLVQALARVEGSGDWLRGGVVAYSTEVKRNLLGVSAAKVVSAQAAEEMASAARSQLSSDVAVAVTGVGGPDPQDGEPPGTVWIGVGDEAGVDAELIRADGSPEDVCRQAVMAALQRLIRRIET